MSAALLAGVIWWVSPERLLAALGTLNWPLLLPSTVIMVALLYLWDAACIPLVYGVETRSIRYPEALHIRGMTYLAGAFNYELGQAVLAWSTARLQRVGLVRMLARTVLLAYHDILVLLAGGMIGSLFTDDSRVERLRPFVAIGLVGTLVVGAIFWALSERIRARIRLADTESLLAGWSLRRSLKLLPMRFGYFAILVVYAAVALSICRVPVDFRVVASTVPLVLLADGLPNFAGFGTRETTLQLVLVPGESDAVLLAMSLVWTSGMMIVRLLIGLANLWVRPFIQQTSEQRQSQRSSTPPVD